MDPADPVASARLQLKPVSEIKDDSKTGSNILTILARQLRITISYSLQSINPFFATKSRQSVSSFSPFSPTNLSSYPAFLIVYKTKSSRPVS